MDFTAKCCPEQLTRYRTEFSRYYLAIISLLGLVVSILVHKVIYSAMMRE